MRPSLFQRLKSWYEGVYIPYEDTSRSDNVVFGIGGYYERPWLARAIDLVFGFCAREWKWLIPVLLTAIGLAIAAMKL